jgi:hypothetical protein
MRNYIGVDSPQSYQPREARSLSGAITSAIPQVTFVRDDHDALQRVASAALYPHTSLSLSDVHAHIVASPPTEQIAIIAAAAGERAVRFHKPGASRSPLYL